MTTKVFVYGTLRSGFGNNRLLVAATKVGAAVTRTAFNVTNCGFPFATEEALDGDPGLPLLGEVYEVDEATQHRLDQLEGHPHFYERVQRSVELLTGELLDDVWIYTVRGEMAFRFPLVNSTDNRFHWKGVPT